MKLETAIQKAFDRINLEGDGADIYETLYRYKAIRELPQEEIDKIYDDLAEQLGFAE